MERIGRYTVIRKIGSGGMAEVFLSRSHGAQSTEKLLVIKKIHPALAKNAKFIDMFVDEAHVAMRLNHINVVQVYAFEKFGDAYVLAMEYVDGPNLLEFEAAAQQEEIRLPFGLAAYIAAEVAKGLDYAHSRHDDRGQPLDIVHRDISPQNILLSKEGAVKIADFGIARARWLQGDTDESIKGKFGYMAPEQAAGDEVDRRSDIYALGVVLYETLVGRPLITFRPGDDRRVIVQKTRHASPIEVDSSVPRALDAVVKKAIAPNPNDRFQTAREMAQALGRYLHKQTDIFDAQALENWIDNIVPDSSAGEPLPEEDTITAQIKPLETGSDEDITFPGGKLGEAEQRATILVSGQFNIGQHYTKEDVSAELFRLIDEMTYKAEGILRQRNTGFSVFLGLFHSSMEDAIKGIRFAHDVLDAARALSRDHHVKIHVKLAINKGTVSYLPGPGGAVPQFNLDPELSEESAALLEAAQYGDITVDDRIYWLATREYYFERADDADTIDEYRGVEHEADKPRFYRTLGAKSRRKRSREIQRGGSFFGRERELNELRQALREATSGRLVVFKLTGEVGVGKSRLVSHFLETELPNSVYLLKVECLFAERDRPLASAVAGTRDALGLPEGKFEQALGDRLEDLFKGAPRYMDRQTRFLKKFLGSTDRLWANYKGGQRELIRSTAHCLGVLISLSADKRPIVLVVENAHWLDWPSIDVLNELTDLRTAIPMLILFVGHPSTSAGRHIGGLSNIELKELPDLVLREIILERLGSTESMQALAEQIIVRTQGNPYFANEIIDSLIEQRIITQVKGEGTVGFRQFRPGTIPLPATMEGIAGSRIDALTPEQRTVLRTASAVGSNFTVEIVSNLVDRDVEEDVKALVSQGMLVRMVAKPGHPVSFRFSQPMVREAAYGAISVRDRLRLHRAMAEQLSALSESGEMIPKVRVAWHLDRAGETDSAGRYYLEAGREAMSIYSNRNALKLFDRAIPRLPKDSEERFGALTRREWVLRDMGRYKEREDEINEMERIARILDEDALCSHVKTRRAHLKYDLSDFVGAAKELGQSIELAARAKDIDQQVEALRLLAYVAVEEGHLIRALDCCNRALAIIPGEESTLYLRGRALGIKGFVLLNMGHLDDAAAPLAEALILFRRLKKRRNESQVLSNLSLLAQARGELTEAVDFLESAIRIDAEVYDIRLRGRKMATMAGIHTDLGDFKKAHASFRESRTFCKENREPFGEVDADLGLANLMLLEGNSELAREILEDVGRRDVVAHSRLRLVRHRQLTAYAMFYTGFTSVARRLAEEATKISVETGMNGEAVNSGVRQGLILAESGRVSEALIVTRRATDLLTILGKVRRADEVWWLHARTLHKAGNTYRAERALAEAQKEVERKRSRINDQMLLALYDEHPLVQAIREGLH